MTIVHTPSLGWIDVDVSIDALFADAHATAAEHADRLYRRFQAHALCEWQQPVCDAIPDEDYDDPPDDAPGSSDPETGESERTPAAPRMSLSSPTPLGTPADATAASSVGFSCDVNGCLRGGEVHWTLGGRYDVLLCGAHALGMVRDE